MLLQELARAIYWPIVPVHALIRELGRAREELCDNHVLQGRDALSYGETLLHLAVLSQGPRSPVAAVGILQWKGELERRIAGLLDQGRSTMTKNNRWLVCLVALLFAPPALSRRPRGSARGAGGPGWTLRGRMKPKDAKATPGAAAKADREAAAVDAGSCAGAGWPSHGRGQDPSAPSGPESPARVVTRTT